MANAWERVAREMGVTRVARVTGLERAGVEVACAVRPGGHVLQVSNGKGESAEEAEWGAVCEAAELWGAERVAVEQLRFGRAEEMEGVVVGDVGPVVEPRLIGARIAWRKARELVSGGEVWVPAQAVHCPPAGVPMGPGAIGWSSNGMGAHRRPGSALAHALLEVAERDGLARALPGGWTRGALRRRKIRAASLPRKAARLVERLGRAGFAAHLFDLRARGGVALPLCGALLVDREEGPVPLTAGYACRASGGEALAAALLEAAQSRVTDVHGAREDVEAADRPMARELAREAEAAGATVEAGALGAADGAPGALLERVRRAGFGRVAAVELAPPGFPLSIVKVLVPGMRVSELL